MRTGHLFAGIGGGILSDLILGHTPIFAVEWDKYACKILRERVSDGWFPEMRVYEGDVRMFDPSEYAGRVDCLAAGFPCTDLSVAGKQAGLGEGTRSGLYREVLRIAGIIRPRYLFLENVSAILSMGGTTVIADLAKMGYVGRALCIRASDVGAPHGRDRWFALAERRDFSPHPEHNGDGRGEQQQAGVESTATMGNTPGAGQPSSPERPGEGQAWGASSRAQQYRGWWEVESDVGRVANGIPHRVYRLKGLGNAQVPLQAAAAFRLLMGG